MTYTQGDAAARIAEVIGRHVPDEDACCVCGEWYYGTPNHGGPSYEAHVAAEVAAELRLSEAAEAMCSADSILSLLRYRYSDQLGGQNRDDVNAASDKLERLRSWYEPLMPKPR